MRRRGHIPLRACEQQKIPEVTQLTHRFQPDRPTLTMQLRDGVERQPFFAEAAFRRCLRRPHNLRQRTATCINVGGIRSMDKTCQTLKSCHEIKCMAKRSISECSQIHRPMSGDATTGTLSNREVRQRKGHSFKEIGLLRWVRFGIRTLHPTIFAPSASGRFNSSTTCTPPLHTSANTRVQLLRWVYGRT